MFNPNQHDVRQFFCETYQKTIERTILTPLESIASHWIVQHPEYQAELTNADTAKDADYSFEKGKTNPFLHLSLHLAIAEQISINRPMGITPLFTALAEQFQSEHEAHHVLMECLANTLWESQRHQQPYDDAVYVAAVQERLQRIKTSR